ncbi:hypothetical protein [Pseudomonas sp. Marseille-QA0892]
MKTFTDGELLELLRSAHAVGASDAVYEIARGFEKPGIDRRLLELIHADTGGFDGKGQAVGEKSE